MQIFKVVSNHQWRAFRDRSEVPTKTLQSEFDWLDESESSGFFQYYRRWYHLSEFLRDGIPGWDGHNAYSYFSGMVIKVSGDGENYMVGTYYVE